MPSMPAVKRLRWWPLACAVMGLLACSAPPPARVVSSAPSASAVRPARLPAPVRPVPVMPRPAPAAPVGAPPAAPPVVDTPVPPEPPAIAARFPDPAVELRTPAFLSGHVGFTGNAELQAAVHALVRERRGEGASVKLLALGTSQAGVPLEALLFSRLPDIAPAAIAAADRPTVLLVGQQHGDEPAGSEALLVVAQELAQGRLQGLLDRINVIVLPRANPDGAQAGRRATASGIDLNRDHLLLSTPEAQAQAQLVRDYRPMVIVDAHEYPADGAFVQKFGVVPRYDALLQYAMTANLPEFITKASEEWFRQPLAASLKGQGLSSQWYHASSNDPNDRKLAMGSVQPDTARNAHGLTNAVSLLVETRGAGLGMQHLKRRVHTHVVAAESVLRSTADRAADLVKLRRYVDNEVASKACQGDAVVEAAPTPSEYSLVMLDPQTGADKAITVAWDSALELHPLKTRPRPCGYWLSSDATDAVTRLRALGVSVQQLDELGEMRAELYQAGPRAAGERGDDGPGPTAGSAEARRVPVSTVPALLDAAEGSYYVGLDQPLANIAIAALEPDTPHSYAAHRIISSVDAEARVMLVPNVKMSPLP